MALLHNTAWRAYRSHFPSRYFFGFDGGFRLDPLIKYMPKPIVTGFTSGIAIVIFSGQIKDLLGLDLAKVLQNL